MKTKTLVLAAAALAVGVLSASAQGSNVYSLNIVGYVNVEIKPGYNLVANPLDDGKGNLSTNLIPSDISRLSQVLVYTAGGGGYSTATKKASGWDATFVIPPGNGYFIKNTTNINYTNTYVGNVLASVPGSVTNNFQPGYNLVGSPYPIGGGSTNMGSNTMNLADGLPRLSQVLVYANPGGYSTATKKASGWDAAFTINVGQGFFIKNQTNVPTPWIQNVGP